MNCAIWMTGCWESSKKAAFVIDRFQLGDQTEIVGV
jgi:hypothetical protein